MSEYESKDELMKVLLASCYIPFYVGLDFPEFKGQKWADGGLTNNLPIPPFGHTLLISPFSGKNNHICPEDESQGITDITFHNMNIYVNRENLQRELQIFIPPKRGGIEIIQKRYDDTLRFLQREKLCDYSP
ncbi:hypothetical protein QZH41_018610 [Actinostola sp. cb2023]|nr:hypothetical protein QZH41_018610 [Actinostola sp. cb2023]